MFPFLLSKNGSYGDTIDEGAPWWPPWPEAPRQYHKQQELISTYVWEDVYFERSDGVQHLDSGNMKTRDAIPAESIARSNGEVSASNYPPTACMETTSTANSVG
jgi:hypothetical protein